MYTIRFECSCLPQLPFIVNNLLEAAVMGPGDIGTDTGYYAQAPFPPSVLLSAYLKSDDIKGPADRVASFHQFWHDFLSRFLFYVEEQLCMDNGLSVTRNGERSSALHYCNTIELNTNGFIARYSFTLIFLYLFCS